MVANWLSTHVLGRCRKAGPPLASLRSPAVLNHLHSRQYHASKPNMRPDQANPECTKEMTEEVSKNKAERKGLLEHSKTMPEQEFRQNQPLKPKSRRKIPPQHNAQEMEKKIGTGHHTLALRAEMAPNTKAVKSMTEEASSRDQSEESTTFSPLIEMATKHQQLDPLALAADAVLKMKTAANKRGKAASKSPRKEPSTDEKPALIKYHSSRYALARAPTSPSPLSAIAGSADLTPDFLAQLTLLASQGPHYITTHIHGKPYLVTAGDTIRLPFLMHGVMPGDVLRLDRASILGSREWTLRAGSRSLSNLTLMQQSTHTPPPDSDEMGRPMIGRTDDIPHALKHVAPHPNISSQLRQTRPKLQNKMGYLDPSLFVCRATVLGTESEPLRTMEKTKRRQRHVRHVRSKHRYTILKISEVEVRVPGSDMDFSRIFAGADPDVSSQPVV